jgi:hypothetical protein
MRKFFTKSILSGIIFFLSVFLLLKDGIAKDVKVYEAKLEEIPYSITFGAIRKIVHFEDTLYVLDMENHRIILIKDKEVIGQIGRIGNGKGELYYPEDFFITKDKLLYVMDSGNNRIEIFNLQGKYLYDFPVHIKSLGMGTNSKGEIFLGQPALKNIISVYNSKGKHVRSFGSLMSPSELYGENFKKYDRSHIIPLNRVWLTLDNEENLWLGFLHAPLICKYNQMGKLIFKKIIDLPDLDKLKKAVWQSPPPSEYLSMNIDGIQLTLIIKDITFDKKNKEILVLFGDNRILSMDLEGNEEFVIKPKLNGAIEKISKVKDEILVSIFFSPKIYKLNIEKNIGGVTHD